MSTKLLPPIIWVLSVLPAFGAAPSAITDLAATPGSEAGTIVLTWTNPPETLDRYILRYKNVGVINNAWFSSALNVSDLPNTFTSGDPQNVTVYDLTPGVTYFFAIKTELSGLASGLSNGATDYAGLACTAGVHDGEGTPVLDPTTMEIGEPTITTMTFTVGAGGIGAGGIVALKVPDFWQEPDEDAPLWSYGASSVTTNGAAVLTMETSGQFILARVDSGSLSSGDEVSIRYVAWTCSNQNLGSFRVYSQAGSCGELIQAGSALTVSLTAGGPEFIQAVSPQYIPESTVVPVNLIVQADCGRPSALLGPTSFYINTKRFTSGVGYEDDDDALVGASAGSVTSSDTFIFANAGDGMATFYYRLNTRANRPNNYVHFMWPSFEDPMNIFYPGIINMLPVNGTLSGVSVDLGTVVAGQTSVTMTPDGNGTDDRAFINFTLPESNIDWTVNIKQSGTNTVIRRFSGYGNAVNRLSWDGSRDFMPGVAPPGTYNVFIELDGGVIRSTNTTISINAIGVLGNVTDGSSPVDNANINIFGTNGGNGTRSAGDGTFSLYGLRSGIYTLEVSAYGFSNKRVPITLGTTNYTINDLTLVRGSSLKLGGTRTGSSLPEVYGNVNVHSADWSQTAFGTLHFAKDKTTSDAGDSFNMNLTTYTEVFLEPGVNYIVEFNVSGYSSTTTLNVNLTAGETREYNLNFTKSGNIEGLITLPAGYNNAQGLHVSVEAGPDLDLNDVIDEGDFSQRRWGGVWLSPGELSGYYELYGLANATYSVHARVPGFVQAQRRAVIANNADALGIDFSSFDTGGTLTINITVNGDTTGLDDGMGCSAGYFDMSVNTFSPATYNGGFAQVCMQKHLTQSTGTAAITGLANGAYEVFTFLPGFEVSPPGPQSTSVTSGSGTKPITLNRLTGRIAGGITLPTGQSDYNNVDINLSYFGGFGRESLPSAVSTGLNTYEINGLGTGFYRMTALYRTTGLLVDRSVQVVNRSGQISTVDLDMRGETYGVTGIVNSIASSPFNSLDYLVDNSTPTIYIDVEQSTFSVPANTILAERINEEDRGGPMMAGMSSLYPSLDRQRVFFATYSASGDYAIPHLTPGTYRLYNHSEIDGDTDNGPEIAETSRIIHIISSTKTGENFTLTDGYDISGTLRVDSGIADAGRTLRLTLLNATEVTVAEESVNLVGTSVDFTLERIPPGDYILSVQDFQFPRKYSAKDLGIEVVSADVTGLEVVLLKTAKIKGRLRVKTSGELLTSNNYSTLLPSGFGIFANANPWFPGGHGNTNFPLIGSDGTFSIDLNPGSYDVSLRSETFLDESAVAQGKKQFVPIRLSGIEVEAGQTKDIGIVELAEGIQIKGVVTDKDGNPLPNILVEAEPTLRRNFDRATEAVTNSSGAYTLFGIDPDGDRYYTVIAAPRPDSRDNRFTLGFTGTIYGEARRTGVDAQKIASGLITSVDFQLEPALGSVTGRVTTPDDGQIYMPFDDIRQPGAEIIMNRQGDVPTDNPLGNIDGSAAADGTFTIKGLIPGSYDMWILAEGYGNGYRRNITVQDTEVDLEEIELSTGTKLYGTLTKADGSLLDEDSYDTVIGVRNGFEEVIIGAFTTDAGGSITDYAISGLQPDKAYSILLLGEDDDIALLGSGIIVNTETELNFVVTEKKPEIFAQAFKDGDSYTLRFELTKALRNSSIDLDVNGTPDDSDPEFLIRVPTAANLSFPAEWITADRKKIIATYTPSAGETSVVVTASCTFVSMDPATGLNFQRTKTFTIPLGIGKSVSRRVTNANGGSITLEGDTSELQMPSGIFGVDASTEAEVQVSAADDLDEFSAQSARMRGQRVLANFEKLGARAYPAGMARAMNKSRAFDVDEFRFGSFYDILLPDTVSHFFPTGKEARMCLSYDEDVTDAEAQSLNVYYFNEQTDEFLLESANKAVDTENQRICVSLAHASVFTVLNSTVGVIHGGTYTGALTVMNFPNPFNLKSKNINVQDPGSHSVSNTIDGTMIKVSVPDGMAGAIEIDIFSVTGEKVRTVGDSTSGGEHVYIHWDGKNDGGEKVASGAYVARLTIGGANEKFFKMAVLK